MIENSNLRSILDMELGRSLRKLKGNGVARDSTFWWETNLKLAEMHAKLPGSLEIANLTPVDLSEFIDVHRQLIGRPSILLTTNVLLAGKPSDSRFRDHLTSTEIGSAQVDDYNRLTIGLLRLIVILGQYLKTS